jgi:type IV secretory pathway TraG/TraD family ATPase VirD4
MFIVLIILFLALFLIGIHYLTPYLFIFKQGYIPYFNELSAEKIADMRLFNALYTVYINHNTQVDTYWKTAKNDYFLALALSIFFVLFILVCTYFGMQFLLKIINGDANSTEKATKNLHGNASFAVLNDLIKQNLIKPKEPTSVKPTMILGKFNSQLIEFNQAKFVALAAPTRAGKGVGIVIPNLLHWQSSVVCLDIKGENFELTSGYRAQFSKIYRFDPFSTQTHAYNPLSYVSRNPQ